MDFFRKSDIKLWRACVFFFFFKQKTAYEISSRDWSSDVCSSDLYFQIVKCFRDEDLRADRQPEFTQVDLEISFATENLVFSMLEPLMGRLLALIGRDVSSPFRRMPYAEAIASYGSDKPDLRAGMELK